MLIVDVLDRREKMRIIRKCNKKFILSSISIVILFTAIYNFYALIGLFVGTVRSTEDKTRDAMFDKAIEQISDDKSKKIELYDVDLSHYFANVRSGLTDKEYENYIDKRLGLKRGPTISEYLGYSPVYQLSGGISGLTLKSYSHNFSLDELLIFGFSFSDPQYSHLIRTGTHLVYTGAF
ncbi:hypothetical protein MKK70_26695 [Methylobacterium sp. E-041]|uniref:hypothetical protein n=1 Tax=unclassified Methylobacterium TaxID=2615210 RepID=UPI001FBAC34F|nr:MULTISPECIES: hypothetical protein [unclassified Methylobacterium]MCJ2108899.1 hypothetical protein [Methylobacterium sp. E-041]MCJ2111930.1 hypothetical protein [Methylobacterium sp. E-025]